MAVLIVEASSVSLLKLLSSVKNINKSILSLMVKYNVKEERWNRQKVHLIKSVRVGYSILKTKQHAS